MESIEILKKGLAQIDVQCSEKQTNAFMAFLLELKKWNRAYNLTALRTDEEIIIKHFLDSLLYMRAIPEGPSKLADAGTGAGFPGIPIKITRPEIDLTLIESSRKKTAFLRHIVRFLRMKAVNVVEQRLEALGKGHEKTYDILVSRATFNIKKFIEVACPYIRENGILILNKGPKLSEELKELEEFYRRGHIKEMHNLRLPFSNAERYLVVLECKTVK
jgi:16S rRNA (guanine527-N7)-methyltransferase